MEIIAVCNQKGGCAKTTTAINLAAALGLSGKKVLVVDNDAQGNLTQSIGVKEYKHTIYDCMTEDLSIKDAVVKTEFKNISIVPADLNYSNMEMAFARVEKNEFLLKKAFEKDKIQYDYVLIDCSPSLSLTTVNALVCADSVLIPLEPSIFNLQGLAQLINVFKLTMNNYNNKLKVKGVLLTRVDSRSNLSDDFAEQLKEIFGKKLFDTMIHQNVAIVRSQIEKKPLAYFDKNSKGHKEYVSLAKEMIKRG
ncbi:ParA family protein [Clostridium aestuarii]|uniref:ParA family protein n=1 Tax=Clostridium aestuarii TaxID=338193 RepID=A0ABT4D5W3_9CLOT|nr:ParA family protein [Clostridium aestuarii]MCY6485423.1 ParA family protein [Clostridium aestuarii]